MLYMFLADGFEETEAIACLDVIRRADIPVSTAGVRTKTVTGSHGVSVVCDIFAEDYSAEEADGVILPGGMPGTMNLLADPCVSYAVDSCAANGKLVAAICAAPLIPGTKGILKGKEATCFPGFEDKLEGAVISDRYCVTSGNVITAKGMGSAVRFGLEIVRYFKGSEFSDKLASTLQIS